MNSSDWSDLGQVCLRFFSFPGYPFKHPNMSFECVLLFFYRTGPAWLPKGACPAEVSPVWGWPAWDGERMSGHGSAGHHTRLHEPGHSADNHQHQWNQVRTPEGKGCGGQCNGRRLKPRQSSSPRKWLPIYGSGSILMECYGSKLVGFSVQNGLLWATLRIFRISETTHKTNSIKYKSFSTLHKVCSFVQLKGSYC